MRRTGGNAAKRALWLPAPSDRRRGADRWTATTLSIVLHRAQNSPQAQRSHHHSNVCVPGQSQGASCVQIDARCAEVAAAGLVACAGTTGVFTLTAERLSQTLPKHTRHVLIVRRSEPANRTNNNRPAAMPAELWLRAFADGSGGGSVGGWGWANRWGIGAQANIIDTAPVKSAEWRSAGHIGVAGQPQVRDQRGNHHLLPKSRLWRRRSAAQI